MTFEELNISGVYYIVPNLKEDARGGFYRFYCKQEFERITNSPFVQMNYSINRKKGTLRGLHYQKAPFQEEKIVRCMKGKVYDVFLDLRASSPTFLKWGSKVMSENENGMLFLPKGIAHGFISLEDNSHLHYQHSEYYMSQDEAGVRYDDPLIKIEWPIEPTEISDRDLAHPYLKSDFKGV